MITGGILNVYKEKGYTSHDVAAKLRRILNTRKTGHTGTLDPMAEGVLPVGVGSGTKLCDMLTNGDKEYVAELILGVVTDTEDMTGEVLENNIPNLRDEDIISYVMSFRGDYLQTPPMYSAIKVNGKKLYELAREGIEIERKQRPVSIKEIEILSMGKDAEGHPLIKLRVLCSKGTYIRTLCKDIGEKAGCGGCMFSLLRTKAAGFSIEDAKTLSQIEDYAASGRIEELIIPVDNVLDKYEAVSVNPQGEALLKNGNALYLKHIKGKSGWDDGERARVYDCAGKFCGIYEFEAIKGRFKAYKMFLN